MFKNWHFSKGVSLCCWSKIGHFFTFCMFGNIGQENVFYGILERKNACLGNKNKKFKESKNWHFSKGVSPCFWSKIGHYFTFSIFGNIGQENVFHGILERENAFVDEKTKKFKMSKHWHFSKRVSPCFWSKIGFFSTFSFLGKKGQENVLDDILDRKNAFIGYKNNKFKKSKNWHFSKRVSPCIWSKIGYFSTFCFLDTIGQENVFDGILERKNAFLGNKNKKLKRSKNWHFSKGVNPCFWSKIGHFTSFCFLGNIVQENVFYDILERRNTFLGYKNNKFKKSKNWHCSKGVSPCFWSTFGHFSTFPFLVKKRKGNVFDDILERKNAFLGSKNMKFEKSKNWHFSKGVSPGFSSKIGHFTTFCFFGNIGQGNVFYDILERKNAFLGYKNNKFKKSKNWHFSKGVSACFWSKIGHFSTFCFLGNIGQGNVFYDILKRNNAFLGYKNNKLKKSKN